VIYIWDNEEDYTDHTIYIVEEAELSHVDVVEVLQFAIGGKLLATAEVLSWFDNDACTRLHEIRSILECIGQTRPITCYPNGYGTDKPTWLTYVDEYGTREFWREENVVVPNSVVRVLSRLTDNPLAVEVVRQLRAEAGLFT